MHERSTNFRKRSKEPQVHCPTEAENPEGMGADRKRGDRCRKAPDSPSYPVPMAKSPGTRCRNISERQTAGNQSATQRAGGGKPQAQRGPGSSNPGADAFKKKDELALSNRRKGAAYSRVQRARIVAEVARLKTVGIPKGQALKELGVQRSTYYSWLHCPKPGSQQPSVQRLTENERSAVISKKMDDPHLSHRMISGYLRSEDIWVDFPGKSGHGQAQRFIFCFSYSAGERYPSVECFLCRL